MAPKNFDFHAWVKKCHFGNFWKFWKIAKMALFYPCMKIKIFLGQMTLFEVLRKCHLVTLSKICLPLRPCAYSCGYKWIIRIFSKLARAISKILFILGLYNFLAYLECVRSYAWSKGHSETDLGSVTTQSKYPLLQ